jgi:hypothetical protein
MRSLLQYASRSRRTISFYGILFVFLLALGYLSFQISRKEASFTISDQSVVLLSDPHLRFEKNEGQADSKVAFLCRGKNHVLFLTTMGSVMHLLRNGANQNSIPLKMELLGANPNPKVKGTDLLKSRSNYFRGNDPARWLTDIPHYARVAYEGVYDGIDLVYYINNNEVEFDLIVKPGIKPDVILLRFSGTDKVKKNRAGDIIVRAGSHELIYRKPLAWQTAGNEKHNVDVQYTFTDDNCICFNLGAYDTNEPLVIDPQFVYSTYLGGTETEIGYAIAVDEEGCAYVAGSTSSTDFPTFNSFQSGKSPGMFNYLRDVFVTKFNPEGTDIVFSTYLGGNWDDDANGIALDKNHNIYLTGTTFSEDDPDTPENEGFPLMSAYQNQIGDDNFSDAFVTVLNSTGSTLLYSTYFGGDGEDQGTDIAVSSDGYAYITGVNFSFDLPVKNAYMSTKPSYYYDAFVAKLNPAASGENSLVYSTYLGGNLDDWGYGIAVDQEGCAYVTGSANSTDFPTTPDPIQGERKASSDIFVTKFSVDGLSLVYSTYIGSDGGDEGKDIEVDTAGCAYVCGAGREDFPTTPGAFMTSGRSSFVSKLLPDGSGFVYSTLVPLSGKIAVDDTGQVYIAAGLARLVGEEFKSDAYVVVLNPEGSDTLFTIVFGGSESERANDIAVDDDRSIYLVGNTSSTDFPVENAFQSSQAGKNDVFVTKFGKSKKKLVLEVLQDPLNHDALPIPNTLFDIYAIDLSKRSDPLSFIETQATDEKGLLHLSPDYYFPGMPIFIRITAEKKPAVKNNHFNNAENMYQVYVDNLIIDNSGKIEAQLLERDSKDTTRTYLGHTSLGYNLVVSVEWLASYEYIINLVDALARVSNTLYDVTNGQVFIDYVSIYDNGKYWKDADIQIFADNGQWPEATPSGIDSLSDKGNISLPPAFYHVNPIINAQKLYEADPIDPSLFVNVRTIVHETGHYALGFEDEYINIDGNYIFTDENFGFMDQVDKQGDPMSTEMSDYIPGDPLFAMYSQTAHYQLFQKNCWDKFSSSNSKWYETVRAFIHTPKDIGISSSQVMAGPNSDISSPDFSVGDMMLFDINATMSTTPRRDYLLTLPNSGAPAPYAEVRLVKKSTNRGINHGKTTSLGHIKLFNAEEGDKIQVTYNDNEQWLYRETLATPALKKAGNTVETIELKSVTGNFYLLSGLTFNASGEPVYQCQSDQFFTNLPAIRINEIDSVLEEQTLSLLAGKYSAVLNDPGFTEGLVFFSAPDSLGETFFVPQSATVIKISEVDYVYYLSSMQMKLYPEHSETTAEKIALLSSDFPGPKAGLPDSVCRVSDIICLNTYPVGSEMKAKILIHYSADSLAAVVPEAMTLYKWDNGWIPLTTGIDLVHQTVTSIINGPGYYAAFLDLTQSRVVTGNAGELNVLSPVRGQLHPNYPNPFRATTTISFELPVKSQVVLDVFDIQGRLVRALLNKTMDAGWQSAIWDGKNEAGAKVSPGVYFCILRTGTMKLNRKMVLIE